MKKFSILFKIYVVLISSTLGFGQLTSGSTAPNFTLTDINGNQHELYAYLDQGKTVYLDFFACHCPFCWSYHNTNALQDLYDEYGPGTVNDDVMVIAIELDANNGTNEFYGISGNTQGNWVAGTNYPQTNPEGADLTNIKSAYQAYSYPLIYAICPDRTITNIGKKTKEELYAHVATCEPLGILENNESPTVIFGFNSNTIHLLNYTEETGETVQVIDVFGRVLISASEITLSSQIDIATLPAGLYFAVLLKDNQPVVSQKFQK
jgi:cytochrome oxidase Cu insertion factor (SCO1/SenC/PrrC family)